MRTFVFLGVRFMSERSWNVTIDDAARDRALRGELEEQLRSLEAAGQAFAAEVQKAAAEQGQKNDEIRRHVSTVLACNVRLAHRAEQAELLSERLVAKLREAEQQR